MTLNNKASTDGTVLVETSGTGIFLEGIGVETGTEGDDTEVSTTECVGVDEVIGVGDEYVEGGTLATGGTGDTGTEGVIGVGGGTGGTEGDTGGITPGEIPAIAAKPANPVCAACR